MIKRTLLCTVSLCLLTIAAACTPCPEVHCVEQEAEAAPASQMPARAQPALVVAATLGGISRLAARWRIQERRQRGVRKGTRVLLEDGEESLLAVTAIASPLRLDADPDCRSCVRLQGAMPLTIELGRSDGPHSTLEEHPTRLLSNWSYPAKLKASWTTTGIEVRVITEASTRPDIELRWAKGRTLDHPLDQAALALAREAVSAEVMGMVSQFVVLHLSRWPGAREAFPDESLQVQVHAPLLRLILSGPSVEGLNPETIQPGMGQDLSIGVSSSLLAEQGYQSPTDTELGSSQLLALSNKRRALEYRVRVSGDSSYYEVAGITVPGRRGASTVFDLLQAPQLLEAGGRAGHTPPPPERRTKAVSAALKPLRSFLGGLLVTGPGQVSAGLMIARYDSGAMLLESGFKDPRAKPSGPPPAHRAIQSPNPRHPTPRLRAVGQPAPAQRAPKPPWAHPPPQSEPPATR